MNSQDKPFNSISSAKKSLIYHYEQEENIQNQEHHEKYIKNLSNSHYCSNLKLMSPLQNQIQCKDYSSPIHIADFSDRKKQLVQQQDESSPLILVQLPDNIDQIVQKQNEDSSQQNFSDVTIDIMGNKICEFGIDQQFQENSSPIVENKENQISGKYLNTPLKIKNNLRSPLQDITPSMTHKKRKDTTTNSKITPNLKDRQKNYFLTPRTMAESRLKIPNTRIKIQRF